MKKRAFWMIWIIPTINIIFMNAFDYAEEIYTSGETYNWWGQFLLILIELLFYAFHYILAFLIPVLLCRRKKEFSLKSGLFAVTAVFVANIILLMFEWMQAGHVRFPQYMIPPVCITMITVIIVSVLIVAKQRHGRE